MEDCAKMVERVLGYSASTSFRNDQTGHPLSLVKCFQTSSVRRALKRNHEWHAKHTWKQFFDSGCTAKSLSKELLTFSLFVSSVATFVNCKKNREMNGMKQAPEARPRKNRPLFIKSYKGDIEIFCLSEMETHSLAREK